MRVVFFSQLDDFRTFVAPFMTDSGAPRYPHPPGPPRTPRGAYVRAV